MSEVPRSDCDEIPILYPEVRGKGLARALWEALAEAGYELPVTEINWGNPLAHARAEARGRYASVYLTLGERGFRFDFSSRGVRCGGGSSPDLRQVAGVLDRWLARGCTLGELTAAFPFVAIHDYAWAFERGDGVKQAWKGTLLGLPPHHSRFLPFVEAALRRKEMRALYPYFNLQVLTFSRSEGHPYTHDTPSVTSQGGGRYWVMGRDGTALGGGDAEAAVEVVVAHLRGGSPSV